MFGTRVARATTYVSAWALARASSRAKLKRLNELGVDTVRGEESSLESPFGGEVCLSAGDGPAISAGDEAILNCSRFDEDETVNWVCCFLYRSVKGLKDEDEAVYEVQEDEDEDEAVYEVQEDGDEVVYEFQEEQDLTVMI